MTDKEAIANPNTEVTVGMLKKIIENLPDDANIRVWDHYLGYSVMADVYAKLRFGQLGISLNKENGKVADLVIFKPGTFDRMQSEKDFNPRWITLEHENDIPFEKKSVAFYVSTDENGELDENTDN